MEKIGVLWDLDGTLLDTLADLTDGVNHAMEAFGYPKHTLEEVRSFMGYGVHYMAEHASPAGGDADGVVAAFKPYYAANCQNKTVPYPGIPEALEVIGRRYPMAIVSNKPDVAVKKLCGHYFPDVYARGESTDCRRKPNPDMVIKAMEDLGVSRCIYVGDSEVDIETAKNAGVPCLSVLWGFRSREQNEAAGGIYFCDDPALLPEMIGRIAGKEYGK